MTPEVQKLLADFAAGLGTTAEYLWSVWVPFAVARATANAYTAYISAGVAALMFTGFMIWRPLDKGTGKYTEDVRASDLGAIISAVLTLVGLIASICYTSDFLVATRAPEGYAMAKLLEVIR